ncbi:e9imm peptide [Streptomyces sp. NPDC000941]
MPRTARELFTTPTQSRRAADNWLDMLDRALACPAGHVSGLISWPPERELSADEVVDHALAYRPIAL